MNDEMVNYVDPNDIPDGMAISFKSFVHYVLNTPVAKLNVHFQPTSWICQPCEFNYAFIIRQETFFNDFIKAFSIMLDKFQGPTKQAEITTLKYIKANRELLGLQEYATHDNAIQTYAELFKSNSSLSELMALFFACLEECMKVH